ncbi:hypothetical protein RF11_08238 [Thelohanellus kitauei]|uniref:Uncharacterized protein n=1 Tax=Thelohanellus kitauei TaxID=669202 RepID=A0A0C2M3U3_THEKT|nr:hypothetical protein RF11_08238 [Thelohanellus kitauei]
MYSGMKQLWGPPPKTLGLPKQPLGVRQFGQTRPSPDGSEAVWSMAFRATLPGQEHRSTQRRETIQLLSRRAGAELVVLLNPSSALNWDFSSWLKHDVARGIEPPP